MLPGPSFMSAFISSINLLILSGFSLTSFHLAEPSLYILVCAVAQKILRNAFYL